MTLDKTVDVALAEFAAVRALINLRFQMQVAILGSGLTALGVLVGLVIDDKADRQLLLLVPVLGSSVSVLYAEQNRRIVLMGEYINTSLWPYLRRLTKAPVPSWEEHWERSSRTARGHVVVWRALLLVGDLAPVLMFLGASVSALAAVAHEAARHHHLALWWLGLVLTAVSATFSALAVGLTRWSRGELGPPGAARRRKPPAAKQSVVPD
jgi:small-conductance mechanosensitive channel